MKPETEVLLAAHQRAAALRDGDAAALIRLLHPGFRWISHVGEHFDRSGYLAANVGGSTEWHEQRLENVAVTIVDTTAVVQCIAIDDVTNATGRAEFRMPVTQIWVRNTDGWQCLAGHAGPRLDLS